MTEHERYEACVKMMRSCKTKSQLAVAINWVNLLVGRFGGFSFEYAVEVLSVRGAMMESLGVFDEGFLGSDWV